MARRKKGRDLSGWVILDKPGGFTSTAIVNKVRWAFEAKKAGHAGTLDPEATGLLAIALGEATKVIPYVTDDLKAYRFMVRLGIATNTDDAEGEVIAESYARPSDAKINDALVRFRGNIEQVPPQFSAVKIDGERAYKRARDGEEMQLAARPLFVESLEVIARPDPDHVELEMVCGKGGYVRSIARDLGTALGCGGHVVWLRRLWSGPFNLEDAVTLDQIEDLARTPEIDELMIPLEAGLSDLPELPCDAIAAGKMRNGNPGMVRPVVDLSYGDLAWASCDGEALAIGHYRAGELHPARVFVRNPSPT